VSEERFLGKSSESKRGGRKLELAFIPVDKIDPNPYQVRKRIDEESLRELAESIKHQKVLHPILVRPRGDRYELIVGERRWRACRIAGEKEIPAFILDVTDVEQAEISLAENIHREDLSGLEKGEAVLQIFRLNGVKIDAKELSNIIARIKEKSIYWKNRYRRKLDETERKVDDICKKIGKHYSTIHRWIKVTTLPDKIKNAEWRKKEPTDWNILARIADIQDENIQIKLYEKLERGEIEPPKGTPLQAFMGKVVTSINNLLKAGAEEEIKKLLHEGVKITEEKLEQMQMALGLEVIGDKELKEEVEDTIARGGFVDVEQIREIIEFLQKAGDRVPREIQVKVARGELRPQMVEMILRKAPEEVREPIFERIVKGELDGLTLEKTVEVVVSEEVPEALKQLVAVGEASPTRVKEALEVLPETEELTGEKVEVIVKAFEEMMRDLEEFRSRPDYEELRRLSKTFYLHWRMQKGLSDLTCPICGADWTHLKWECCGLNVVEAWKKAQERYKSLRKRTPEDKQIVEVK